MTHKIALLDVVALTEDVSAYSLIRGQVGTVVEELSPDVFEVEFSDDTGRTYASERCMLISSWCCTTSLRSQRDL